MRNFVVTAVSFIFATVLIGCDSPKWKSGHYEIYWIDQPNDLVLGRDLGRQGRIGRVMSQVYAVGEDEKWIVVARYPDGDRTIREFFYFNKNLDGDYKNAEDIVEGPFTRAEFRKKKLKYNLPSWSEYF